MPCGRKLISPILLGLLLSLFLAAPSLAQAADTACLCNFKVSYADTSQQIGTHCQEFATGLNQQPANPDKFCREACEAKLKLFVTDPRYALDLNIVQFLGDVADPAYNQAQRDCANRAFSAVAGNVAGTKKFTVPVLGVAIPNLSFSEPLKQGQYLTIDFIGQYISGVYQWLLGASLTIAIVMIMIGGLQYVLSAGRGDVGAAKTRITNAVIGLILLLSTYIILYTVNPELTVLGPLRLKTIDPVLAMETVGNEGDLTSGAGSNCDQAYALAQQNQDQCKLAGGFTSPTGQKESCNYHFRDQNYQWQNIKSIDWVAPWDSPIRSPFSGTVTVLKRSEADNPCGNTLTIKSSGAVAYICHVKDFIRGDGTPLADGDSVIQGELIGHVGGRCCQGETPPDGWKAAENGWCNQTGTPCDDPFSREDCGCQTIEQSGNTSGPHIHVTFKGAGPVLTCIKR